MQQDIPISLTAAFSKLIVAADYAQLPFRCLEAVNLGFTDCVGVTVAGSSEEACQAIRSVICASASAESAIEIPTGRRLSAPDAALVNGVAAHALDYDDVALSAHPSAVLVPAILAAGAEGNVDGKQAVVAYAVGFEVWARLEAISAGRLHAKGFHPTAIFGAVAASAACAKLYNLDTLRTARALSISASLAAGLVCNFGTMTKPLHAGRASQSGVLAAKLAANGFKASTDALEHPTGFLRAYGLLDVVSHPAISVPASRISSSWALADRGLDIKRYPTCYATHRCIDAAIQLGRSAAVLPEAIAEIDVTAGVDQMLLLRYSLPQNALEAKFSMPFAVTAGLIAGRVGLGELTNDFVKRQDVQALMKKVKCKTIDERMVGDELFAPYDTVSIQMKSGEVHTHPPVSHAIGSWRNPATPADIQTKFMDCTTPILGQQASVRLFLQLTRINELSSLRELSFTREGPAAGFHK